VHADLTSRLAGTARLESYAPRDNVPALVVAYDHYEDIDREQEIVERNAIRHPGFVPVRPLRLLSA
jgi:prophage DNA circulation protein